LAKLFTRQIYNLSLYNLKTMFYSKRLVCNYNIIGLMTYVVQTRIVLKIGKAMSPNMYPKKQLLPNYFLIDKTTIVIKNSHT